MGEPSLDVSGSTLKKRGEPPREIEPFSMRGGGLFFIFPTDQFRGALLSQICGDTSQPSHAEE